MCLIYDQTFYMDFTNLEIICLETNTRPVCLTAYTRVGCLFFKRCINVKGETGTVLRKRKI